MLFGVDLNLEVEVGVALMQAYLLLARGAVLLTRFGDGVDAGEFDPSRLIWIDVGEVGVSACGFLPNHLILIVAA